MSMIAFFMAALPHYRQRCGRGFRRWGVDVMSRLNRVNHLCCGYLSAGFNGVRAKPTAIVITPFLQRPARDKSHIHNR